MVLRPDKWGWNRGSMVLYQEGSVVVVIKPLQQRATCMLGNMPQCAVMSLLQAASTCKPEGEYLNAQPKGGGGPATVCNPPPTTSFQPSPPLLYNVKICAFCAFERAAGPDDIGCYYGETVNDNSRKLPRHSFRDMARTFEVFRVASTAASSADSRLPTSQGMLRGVRD